MRISNSKERNTYTCPVPDRRVAQFRVSLAHRTDLPRPEPRSPFINPLSTSVSRLSTTNLPSPMTKPTVTMSSSQPTKSSQQALPIRTHTSGLRYPSNKKTIYDRNRDRTKNAESGRAAFAYMFVEMIRYQQSKVKDMGELELKCVSKRRASFTKTYYTTHVLIMHCLVDSM